MQLRKAEKQKTKLRMGLAGTSGSGKTYSALLLASGMASSWDRVAVIDTENGSADLYAGLGNYNVITLTAPFTPERYIEAIKACEVAGMEIIVIDSISHEWDGKGGCLEIVEDVTKASSSKNSYTAWAKVTPRHNAFTQAILQSPCHIVTTVRKKQDYDMSKDSSGKTVVSKMGLKEVTREGFEYELTLSFNLSQNHLAEASKDRTGLFMDKPEFVITEETGKKLLAWTESGIEPIKQEVVKPVQPKPVTPVKQTIAPDASAEDLSQFNFDAEDFTQEEAPVASVAKEYKCEVSSCGKVLSAAVAKFSIDKYKHSFCMAHQGAYAKKMKGETK